VITYEQARADFEFLEGLAELYDQVELDAQRLDLMQNPTKRLAGRMYEAAIRLWFSENGGKFKGVAQLREIQKRHGAWAL